MVCSSLIMFLKKAVITNRAKIHHPPLNWMIMINLKTLKIAQDKKAIKSQPICIVNQTNMISNKKLIEPVLRLLYLIWMVMTCSQISGHSTWEVITEKRSSFEMLVSKVIDSNQLSSNSILNLKTLNSNHNTKYIATIAQ